MPFLCFGFVLLKVVSNMLPYSGLSDLSDSRNVEEAKARAEKTLLLKYFAGICRGVWRHLREEFASLLARIANCRQTQ